MTEAEWLACDNPADMLTALFGVPAWRDGDDYFPGTPPSIPGTRSLRKLRLFACACCRSAWGRLPLPDGHRAVELAERYADGAGGGLFGWARRACMRMSLMQKAQAEEMAGRWQESSISWAPFGVLGRHLEGLFHACWVVRVRMGGQEANTHVRLLRCVFGNPFRSSLLELAHRTPLVESVGLAAYEDRELPVGHLDQSRLTMLADALEKAGCTEAEQLAHLRCSGPHVRGCFPLDLVLAKV